MNVIFIYTGFVHSLEFLKECWNLQSNFPDVEKVWKNDEKSVFFFPELQVLNKGLICLSHSQIPLNLTRSQNWEVSFSWSLYVCNASWKKLGSCIFQGLYWSPIVTLSLEKNYCFGKSLEFWIQKSVQALFTVLFISLYLFAQKLNVTGLGQNENHQRSHHQNEKMKRVRGKRPSRKESLVHLKMKK